MALQIKRGLTADLPSTAADGELLFATDTNALYVGNNGAPQPITGGGSIGGDSVLDSALIGDVSIIDNTISAVDEYGNASELRVTSDFAVEVDGGGQTTTYYEPYSFEWMNCYWAGNTLYIDGISGDQSETFLNSLLPGSTVTLFDLAMADYYTLTIVNKEYGDAGSSFWEFNVEEYRDNYPRFFTQTYPVTVVSVLPTVKALSATSTGVAITGTLTVNGTEITSGGGGTAYDQSLNTTDDVVFNSALIGDVTIVDNTISAVDEYGNQGTLVVGSDLEVTGDITSPSALSVTVGGENITYDIDSYSGGYMTTVWDGEVISFPADMDLNTLNTVISLPIGSHIKFTNPMYGGAYDLVTVSQVAITGTGQPEVWVSTSNPYGNFGFDTNSIQLVYTGPTATYGFGTDGSITAGDTAKGQTSVSIKPETFNVIDGVNTSVIKSSTDITKDQQQVIMKIDASPQRSISWENGVFVYSGRHESYVYGIGAGGSPAIDAYLSQYFDRTPGVPIIKDGNGDLPEEIVTSGGVRLLNSRSVHMEATVIARNTSGASKAWKISGVWVSHAGMPSLMPNSYTSSVLGFDDHLTTGITSDWDANIEAVTSPNPIGGVFQNLMVRVNGGTDVYFSASISATIIQEVDTVESSGGGGGK